jgi:hypothetical protein
MYVERVGAAMVRGAAGCATLLGMEGALEQTLVSSPKLLEEAMEEVTGESKRKWALVFIAFLLGIAVLALVIRLVNRTAAKTTPTRGPGPTATGSQASDPESSTRSAWREKRARLARSEARRQARVGRLGSRLNLRRHAQIEQESQEATTH